MVKPADVPEYLTHNTSKRHSPTVAPPGPLVFKDIMRSEMESARVLVGLGFSSSIELVDILLEQMKLNVCPFFEKKN